MSEGVIDLPVSNRRQEENGMSLVKSKPQPCGHYRSFDINTDSDRCFCRDCGAEVSPIFVIKRMMAQESLWTRSRDRYMEDMKKLSERKRVKCQHCGKMAKIRIP